MRIMPRSVPVPINKKQKILNSRVFVSLNVVRNKKSNLCAFTLLLIGEEKKILENGEKEVI